MRPELETYHLIDSYLNGKLEGEALRAFEQQLQSDAAFAEEVEFQKLTNEVVIGASFDDLRSQMTNDINKIDASGKTKTWTLYTVAAFVLLTGAGGLYHYFTKNTETKHTVATANVTSTAQRTATSTNTVVTNDQKITSSTSESQTTISKQQIQAAATNKIDTQQVHVPVLQSTHSVFENTTQETKTVQPAENTPAVNPCLHVQLSAKISSSPSCANENTGSIAVNSIAGGTKPYHVSLDELPATAKTKESYAYLKAETYTVRITDANGCVKTFATTVTEKVCKKNSYVFAPEKGETWKISGNDNVDYTITIINIAGTQVYKSHLMQGEFEWQGIGQQGEYLSAGLYIYVIEYSNGQKENGQVTIVR